MFPVRWHRCPDCEVCWQGSDEECWNCGRRVPGDLDGAPRLTSLASTSAMNERRWAEVRREIGVD